MSEANDFKKLISGFVLGGIAVGLLIIVGSHVGFNLAPLAPDGDSSQTRTSTSVGQKQEDKEAIIIVQEEKAYRDAEKTVSDGILLANGWAEISYFANAQKALWETKDTLLASAVRGEKLNRLQERLEACRLQLVEQESRHKEYLEIQAQRRLLEFTTFKHFLEERNRIKNQELEDMQKIMEGL